MVLRKYWFQEWFLVLIGMSLLAFTTTLIQVIIAAGFIGFGYGCINPTMNAFIMKVSPVKRRGAANATYYAAFDGGYGGGSMIGGVLVQIMGFQYAFLNLIGLMLIGAGFYFKLLRKQIKKYDVEHNIE